MLRNRIPLYQIFIITMIFSVFVVPFLCIYISVFVFYIPDYLITFIWISSIAISFLLTIYLYDLEEKLENNARSNNVRDVVEEIIDGKKCKFFIYLRPFHLEELGTSKADNNLTGFESNMANIFRQHCPVVGLGYQGESFGVGKYTVDNESWKRLFITLMKEARLILIVPGYQTGTLFEICSILEAQYIRKTIFLMPPENSYYKQTEDLKDIDINNHWENTKKILDEFNMKIPIYRPSGSIFYYSNDLYNPIVVDLNSLSDIAWELSYPSMIARETLNSEYIISQVELKLLLIETLRTQQE